MKKIIWLLAILITMSGVAYYLTQRDKKPTDHSMSASRGFTVESMDDVEKVVIRHIKLQPLIFTRQGKGWILNSRYEVDPAVFVNVERVLTNLRLLYIPSKEATDPIIKSIKMNGIQVDVYTDDDEPARIIFIGSDTPKNDGTYMLLGGTNQPYAMHLPGLAGGLRSRFEQPLDNYRDRTLFRDSPAEIDFVKVEYPKDQPSSFIINDPSRNLVIEPVSVRAPSAGVVNRRFADNYLAQFVSLGAEGLLNQYPLRDSVLALKPDCIVMLRRKDGKVRKHTYYSYDNFEIRAGNARTPAEIRGQNRMFVLVNETDFYTVQNRVFGGVFRGYDEFFQ